METANCSASTVHVAQYFKGMCVLKVNSRPPLIEVGRIIKIDTDIAIFEKTETDTDSIFRKTEKYRLS